MMSEIIIYQTDDNQIEVRLESDTIWLDAHQLAKVFNVQRPAIVKHIGNIYKSGELLKNSTCSILEQVAADGKKRKMNTYNLDMIISVGYRINSTRATQFRIWATQRLKDYLIQGYAINEKRLEQKQQEVKHLKDGIRILSRVIEDTVESNDNTMLRLFAKGLELLDDYDHEALDAKGLSHIETVYPNKEDYLVLIADMQPDFSSDVFAQPKDDSFESSINQIRQSFADQELYPSLEEKAAMLLYSVVKNHSFVDGNKRIAAACFLYFLEQNNALFIKGGETIISNDALASLTLFIASSNSEESDTVKKLIVSVLNRNLKTD